MTAAPTVRRWSFRDLTGESTARFSPCERYRYSLTRTWDPSLIRMVFIGLNPSTADAYQDDPTIRRVLGFALREGCGELVMLNLFGLRSTDPRGLRDVADPTGPENDAAIAEWTADDALVVCGWGAHGDYLDRGALVAAALAGAGVRPVCLGVTKDGHPKHPLYLAANTPLVPYGAVAWRT